MANKKIILALSTNDDYVKYSKDEALDNQKECDRLFYSLTFTYLPLLSMLERLEKDFVDFKIMLSLSPVVCDLLTTPIVQEQYKEYLNNRIELGKIEEERYKDTPELKKTINYFTSKYIAALKQFNDYEGKVVEKFSEYVKKGYIEALATCATNIFTPYYYDCPPCINAQVELGIFSYRKTFGERPDGFIFPSLAYYEGEEKILKTNSINYTILDAKSVLLSKNEAKRGIFYPASFDNCVALYAADTTTNKEIYSDEGYCYNGEYLNLEKDIGYIYEQEALPSYISKKIRRRPLGYMYWNKKTSRLDTVESEGETLYNHERALEQVKLDAADYVNRKCKLLEEAEKEITDTNFLSLVLMLDLHKMQGRWFEGIDWIEEVIRKVSLTDSLLSFANPLLEKNFNLQFIHPSFACDSKDGYCEELLSHKNNYMIKYLRKAAERMADIAKRFPTQTGLRERLLNIATKELLLTQSASLPRMINDNDSPEYAGLAFTKSINEFTKVFESLGSNEVSTQWLIDLENEHNLFPFTNYRVFNKKIKE